MKTFKNMGFGPRKSKSGFTLIELLIVMVILAILAGVVVMAVGGVFGNAKSKAYGVTKDELKNAVADYASRNQGAFPYTATKNVTIDGTARYTINMSALLTANGGILAKVPDSMAALSSGANAAVDNCDFTGGTTATCGSNSHYIWGQDNMGNVYSLCDDTNGGSTTCNCTTCDGFQTVYP
jgi:prepilin-type N-terminal cleavage/methylation domain-containing protein